MPDDGAQCGTGFRGHYGEQQSDPERQDHAEQAAAADEAGRQHRRVEQRRVQHTEAGPEPAGGGSLEHTSEDDLVDHARVEDDDQGDEADASSRRACADRAACTR